jgi:putative membrane protein insertion efficiency factor
MSVAAGGLLRGADLSRPPAGQLVTRAALGGIHLYQATLSPLYARAGVMCRFKPTCSRYGEAVVREFGALRGGWLTLRRVLRCGPWTPLGTEDQPPAAGGQVQSSSVPGAKLGAQAAVAEPRPPRDGHGQEQARRGSAARHAL